MCHEDTKLQTGQHYTQALWSVLRKEDALKAVSSGGAQLWYTPSDVNLSIEADCRAKKK